MGTPATPLLLYTPSKQSVFPITSSSPTITISSSKSSKDNNNNEDNSDNNEDNNNITIIDKANNLVPE